MAATPPHLATTLELFVRTRNQKERRTRPDWRPLDWILVVSSPAAPCGIQQFRTVRGLSLQNWTEKLQDLRSRDFSASLADRSREIARPEACRSKQEIARPEAADRDLQASRLLCPDLQVSGLAISLLRSAGLKPRDFSAPICKTSRLLCPDLHAACP